MILNIFYLALNKVNENLKLLLLKIEEAIPVAFIETINKLTTDLITYQI